MSGVDVHLKANWLTVVITDHAVLARVQLTNQRGAPGLDRQMDGGQKEDRAEEKL